MRKCLNTALSNLLDASATVKSPSIGERKPLLGDRSRSPPGGLRIDPWYGSITTLKNDGSHARDYCAAERTFLSHIRLGLVLFSMTAALLCRSQFPCPDGPSVPNEFGFEGLVAIPLGIMYASASMVTLIAGWAWYETTYRRMRIGRAFIEGESKFYEATMSAVCALILVTSLLFFSESAGCEDEMGEYLVRLSVSLGINRL